MNKSYIFLTGIVVILGGVLIFNSIGQDAETAENYTAAENVIHDGGAGDHYELPSDDITPTQTKSSTVTPPAKTIAITETSYSIAPSEVRIKKGTVVTFNIANTDGFHNFVIDGMTKSSSIRAGETTSVTFLADKTGTFEYYCSIGSHRQLGMKGKLIVE